MAVVFYLQRSVITDTAKILIADGESQARAQLCHRLDSEGYDCMTARNGQQVLQFLDDQGPFDLLLCNMKMPDLSGLELLTAVTENYGQMAVIMITAVADTHLAIEAMQRGAYDYVEKPLNVDGLVARVRNVLELRRLREESQLFQRRLEEHTQPVRRHLLIEQRRALELDKSLRGLRRAYDDTIAAIAFAMDDHDHETQGHTQRVTAYSMELARLMGVMGPGIETIRQGSMLHDIGNIVVPDMILHKRGTLGEEERSRMKRHVTYGYHVLHDVSMLKDAAGIVLHHHERYDGSGYPAGVARDEIHRGARIFAIADALDAMTTDRPYRRALGFDDASSEVRRCSGSHFDPEVVDAFFAVSGERWQELRHESERSVKDRRGLA